MIETEVMSDVVLTHGTTQSPMGWERLVSALDARGHHCWAVDPASSADLDVDGYVRVIVEQAGDARQPVVVAHSGSGLLLPAAARALAARHQVWLAAFIPDGRRALLERSSQTQQRCSTGDGLALIRRVIPSLPRTSSSTIATWPACNGVWQRCGRLYRSCRTGRPSTWLQIFRRPTSSTGATGQSARTGLDVSRSDALWSSLLNSTPAIARMSPGERMSRASSTASERTGQTHDGRHRTDYTTPMWIYTCVPSRPLTHCDSCRLLACWR